MIPYGAQLKQILSSMSELALLILMHFFKALLKMTSYSHDLKRVSVNS